MNNQNPKLLIHGKPLFVTIDLETLKKMSRGWPKVVQSLTALLSATGITVDIEELKTKHGSSERVARMLYAMAVRQFGTVLICNPDHSMNKRRRGHKLEYTVHWYFRLKPLVDKVKQRMAKRGLKPTDKDAIRLIVTSPGSPSRWIFEEDQWVKHYAEQQAGCAKARKYLDNS